MRSPIDDPKNTAKMLHELPNLMSSAGHRALQILKEQGIEENVAKALTQNLRDPNKIGPRCAISYQKMLDRTEDNTLLKTIHAERVKKFYHDITRLTEVLSEKNPPCFDYLQQELQKWNKNIAELAALVPEINTTWADKMRRDSNFPFIVFNP